MNFRNVALGVSLAVVAFTASAQGAGRKPYIIELANAPVAGYSGGIAGLKATRPAAGQRLDGAADAVQAYTAFLETKQSQAAALVPEAHVTYRTPALYGEPLSCSCRVGWVGRSSFSLEYRVDVAGSATGPARSSQASSPLPSAAPGA